MTVAGPADPDSGDPASTEPHPLQPVPDQARLRRNQVIGILLVAAAILVFTLLRANWHDLFPHGWWRW